MCKPYVDIPELPWKGDPAPPQSTLPSKFGWPRIRGPWGGKAFFSYFWQTKEGPCGYEWKFCCMKVAEHMYRLMSKLGFVCQSCLTGRTVSKKIIEVPPTLGGAVFLLKVQQKSQKTTLEVASVVELIEPNWWIKFLFELRKCCRNKKNITPGKN